MCITLFSCSFIPAEGFIIVLFYSFSSVITFTKIPLSIYMTLFSCSFKPAEGFIIVLFYPFSKIIKTSQTVLSFCKSFFSCCFIPSESFIIVLLHLYQCNNNFPTCIEHMHHPVQRLLYTSVRLHYSPVLYLHHSDNIHRD